MGWGEHVWLTLPADARSPGRARDFVLSRLEDWGLQRVSNQARLLTSELVTNAVLHARTEFTLTMTKDSDRDVVRVCVTDGSEEQPARRPYSPSSTGGRGLSIVADESQAFGVDSFTGGKAVWFELALGSGNGSGASKA